jgi:hypothetical protein
MERRHAEKEGEERDSGEEIKGTKKGKIKGRKKD